MKKILIVILFFLTNQVIFACSCDKDMNFDIWSYLDFTTIVKGEILSIKEYPDSFLLNNTYVKDGGFQLIELRIEKVFKGNVSNTLTLKSNLPQLNSHDCNKEYRIGEKWYVFTEQIDSNYYFNACFWSKKVGEKTKSIQKDLKYIEKISTIKNGVVKKKYCDRDCSKKRIATGKIVNGQAEGFWKFLDKKGNPIMTGYYSNGTREGLWIDYYRNENELAIENISAKSYHTKVGSVSISYNESGSYIYSYKNIEPPTKYFTKEEIDYINTKNQ